MYNLQVLRLQQMRVIRPFDLLCVFANSRFAGGTSGGKEAGGRGKDAPTVLF